METQRDPAWGMLLPANEAARMLGVLPTKINQYMRDNLLVVVQRDERRYVPAEFLVELPAAEVERLRLQYRLDEEPVPSPTHTLLGNARGTITVLRDCGFNEEEIVDWLWAKNEELGDTPIAVLLAGGHHRVNRIASTLAQ